IHSMSYLLLILCCLTLVYAKFSHSPTGFWLVFDVLTSLIIVILALIALVVFIVGYCQYRKKKLSQLPEAQFTPVPDESLRIEALPMSSLNLAA
ncbi:hypothetical protein PMAYCL1PPCAC_32021, partial [Pristionchus mayeri]